MKKKRWIWISILLISVAYILFIYFNKDQSIKVAIEVCSKKNIIETVSGNGKLSPIQEVKINPETTGEITNIFVKEGDRVNKGQILATIKSSNSKPVLNLSNPLAGLGQTTETIKYHNIYAPISGIVTSISLKKGERYIGNMPMQQSSFISIANMNEMKLKVAISENEIMKIKKNDTVIITVEAYDNREFKGIVTEISQANKSSDFTQDIASITEQITSYTVHILLLKKSYESLATLENNFMPFRSGMSANATIQTKYLNQVLAVPINAITFRQGDDTMEQAANKPIKEIVFIINEKNEAIETPVTTGIQDNQSIQIISGLTENQQVVIAPFSAIARTLQNNMKVKVVSKKELFQEKETPE